MAQFDRMKDDGSPPPPQACKHQTNGTHRRYVQGVRDELEAGTGLWLRREDGKI
jgi:hypothetical protein